MTTTSLKLPDDLKARTTAAAKARGITTHAFMLEAVQLATNAAELRARFVKDALAALKTARKTGKGYAADEVHAYILAKTQGKPARRPGAKSWRT